MVPYRSEFGGCWLWQPSSATLYGKGAGGTDRRPKGNILCWKGASARVQAIRRFLQAVLRGRRCASEFADDHLAHRLRRPRTPAIHGQPIRFAKPKIG